MAENSWPSNFFLDWTGPDPGPSTDPAGSNRALLHCVPEVDPPIPKDRATCGGGHSAQALLLVRLCMMQVVPSVIDSLAARGVARGRASNGSSCRPPGSQPGGELSWLPSTCQGRRESFS